MFRLSSRLVTAVIAVSGLLVSMRARAQEDAGCRSIDQANLPRCALRASLVLRSEAEGTRALAARREAASPVLPSNPVLSFTASRRAVSEQGGVTNWSASLSQEIEIAGQQSARLEAASGDIAAQANRLIALRRHAVTEAWIAYYEALAARDEVTITRRLEVVAGTISKVGRASAERGLASELDADLLDAAEIRTRQVRIAAEGRHRAARAVLTALVGGDPGVLVAVEGELTPIPGIDAAARALGPAERPEVRALEEERKAHAARAALFRRARVPNLTVSAYLQNDGFNERVFGLGVSFPIPLPHPVGRTYAGEIGEAESLARRATLEADRVRRELGRDTARALAEYQARVEARDAVAPDRLARAERSLATIAEEVQRGRLAPREVVVAQQTLIDLLLSDIAARRAVCLASVELARAAGIPVEGEK